MPGGSLDVARAALDSATGQPCRLFWSPVTLLVLSPGRVTSSPFGTVPRRMPSALPSWLWRPAVFTAVVSALAETLLRDLADPDNAAAADGASARVPGADIVCGGVSP